jgi:hypothetical protein
MKLRQLILSTNTFARILVIFFKNLFLEIFNKFLQYLKIFLLSIFLQGNFSSSLNREEGERQRPVIFYYFFYILFIRLSNEPNRLFEHIESSSIDAQVP